MLFARVWLCFLCLRDGLAISSKVVPHLPRLIFRINIVVLYYVTFFFFFVVVVVVVVCLTFAGCFCCYFRRESFPFFIQTTCFVVNLNCFLRSVPSQIKNHFVTAYLLHLCSTDLDRLNCRASPRLCQHRPSLPDAAVTICTVFL